MIVVPFRKAKSIS